jgi:protein-S-isoprenylcysteine O-methyltransferase Ste14
MNLWLAVKNILFVILVPGTVAGYLPYRILRKYGDLGYPSISVQTLFAAIVLLPGIFILANCIWEFASYGRGTPAPFDPPKRLVARGMYRYTRNPMYSGMFLILLSETLLFASRAMLLYTAAVFAGFHLYVLLLEEPRLRKKFGESYREYCHAVPRWGFTLRSGSASP